MGFNELLNQLTPVFTDSEKFGETVTFFSGGENSNSREVNVVWDADSLPGTNEVSGDGVALERGPGRRYRESFMIEVPADLEINERLDPPPAFLRGNGEYALVKRVMASDAAMKVVRCVRTKDKYLRRDGRRG